MKISLPYFPNTFFLQDKWWHKIAFIVSWIWFILTTAVTIYALTIFLAPVPIIIGLMIIAFSAVSVSLVYRVTLNIAYGEEWKK